MSEKRRLVLFTDAFPGGQGEQFLETEVKFLATRFSKIDIYSFLAAPATRVLPENARLVFHESRSSSGLGACLLRHLPTIIRIFGSEFLLAAYRKKYFPRLKSHLLRLLINLNSARRLAPLINQYSGTDTVFYSYWFGQWVDVLCLLKLLYCPDLEFITRAHGYDYDINQTKLGFIPFRGFTMIR